MADELKNSLRLLRREMDDLEIWTNPPVIIGDFITVFGVNIHERKVEEAVAACRARGVAEEDIFAILGDHGKKFVSN